jgi:chromosome segregation ATPase
MELPVIRKPLWSVTEDDEAGGGDGDDDEEEEHGDPGDDGDGDQGDDDGDDDGDLSDAGKKALKKVRDELREARRELREARKAAEKDRDDDDAETKAAERWKPRVVNSAARAALIEAGGTNLNALLKLKDDDELDVRDDGTVVGLDAEVERLKEEYPELFATRRRTGGRLETGDRSGGGSPKKKLSATERQARGLLGKS